MKVYVFKISNENGKLKIESPKSQWVSKLTKLI